MRRLAGLGSRALCHRYGAPMASARHAAGEVGIRSWYLKMWSLLKDQNPQHAPQQAAGGEGEDEHVIHDEHDATAKSSERLLAEAHVLLKSNGNVLPDFAISGLWDLFHQLKKRPYEDQLSFFLRLAELGTDYARLTEQQKKLDETLASLAQLIQKQDGADGNDTALQMTLSAQRKRLEQSVRKQVASMHQCATPLFELWFEQSAALPNGMRNLMKLRKRLLLLLEKESSGTSANKRTGAAHDESAHTAANNLAALKYVDEYLMTAFRDFFAKQYLVLEELGWKTTPPFVLERVMLSEQVHPFFDGLSDLKFRIRDGFKKPKTLLPSVPGGVPLLPYYHQRHLFALFHPSVADEPLISVQVALSSGIESSVDRILMRPTPLDRSIDLNSPQDQSPLDTAIFYSINNAQISLKGIELGSQLIKRVVTELKNNPSKYRDERTQHPVNITTFSTLSPIPGYMRWLKSEAAKLADGQPHRIFGADLSQAEVEGYFEILRAAFGGQSSVTPEQLMFMLISMMTDANDFKEARSVKDLWFFQTELAEAIRKPMMRSAAWYLAREKKRHRLLDPVGNFHVGNGAMVHRLNWLANCTEKGSVESACMMVNYKYCMNNLSANALGYEVDHVVSLGTQLEEILAVK